MPECQQMQEKFGQNSHGATNLGGGEGARSRLRSAQSRRVAAGGWGLDTFRAGNLAHHRVFGRGRHNSDRSQLEWREIFALARRHRAVSVPQ